MATLLTESISKVYRAPTCSCSYLLCFTFSLIIIIIPFFLAASTHDFWLPYAIYQEQPKVLYRNEILIYAYCESVAVNQSQVTKTPSTYMYSTIGELNELNANSMSPADISTVMWDYNSDFYPDMYEFSIILYLQPSTVKNIKIYTNFDYRLRKRVNMDMVTLAIADVNTPNGVSSLYLDGFLNLNQKNPLQSSKIVRQCYNSTLLDPSLSSQNFLQNVFSQFYSRNETTDYQFTSIVSQAGANNFVNINMKIKIPPYQNVWYVPIFLQNLKFAWIQYFCLLLPVWFLVMLFAKYVFSQQIFESEVEIKF